MNTMRTITMISYTRILVLLLSFLFSRFGHVETASNNRNWPTKRNNHVHELSTTLALSQNENNDPHDNVAVEYKSILKKTIALRSGSILSGWNPFGYALTALGLEFLEWNGSLDSDIGRFLASFKSGRKRESAIKDQWLEIVRVSKKGQSMRIYRNIDKLSEFCLNAGFLS